jgi:hypothetical protein
MLRPSRLRYEHSRSWHAMDNLYLRRRIPNAFGYALIGVFFPYVSVKTFNLLDRLPIWEQRLEQRRIEKMSFDWMIKSLAEKERDVIEEFSDY